MDYSCGLGPHLGGSLRRSSNAVRRSISSSKHIGGIDWHLRTQFLEQSKCLDLKYDIDCAVLQELQDFYRRRAIVEQDYADALAKLAHGSKQRHINETTKRPHWAQYTTTTVWNTLLGSTLRVSEAHATLSDLFAKQMVQRLTDMDEDATRLHKQCRDMMSACHERVLVTTAKLQEEQRKYTAKQTASVEADRQRRRAEDKLNTAEMKAKSKSKNPSTSQRYLRSQNEYDAKEKAYVETRFVTAQARNDYLIQLAATNFSVARYFNEEASDIIDCLACGFHNSLARSAMMHLSCEEALKSCHSSIVEMLNRNVTALDWRQDKALFLKCNENTFTRPSPFNFVPIKDDDESQLCANNSLRSELEQTAEKLSGRIEILRVSTEETWKTLEEVEKKLLELINQKDYDVSGRFITEHPRVRRPHNSIISTSSDSASMVNSLSGNLASNTSSVSPAANRRCPSPQTGSSGDVSSSVSRSTPGAISGAQLEENCSDQYGRLRSTYRDQRIEQEKFYLDRFARYTAEMHKCQVMQVQLGEIHHACDKQALQHATSHTQRDSWCILPTNDNSIVQSYVTQRHPLESHTLPTSTPLPPPPAPHQGLSRGRVLALTDAIPADRGAGYTGPCRTNGNATETKKSPAVVVPVSPVSAGHQLNPTPKPHASRRVLRVPNVGKPKLFGSTIDEYVEATRQAIPNVLLSCARVIVQHGLSQTGLFRVSGSQVEILEFKAAFENGDDPLANVHESREINSTAGLLKLYFRELGEPPFPSTIVPRLVECCRGSSDINQTVCQLRQVVVQVLTKPVFVVMRFLFAFLNHISEHASENSMDAYNLAICFAPTLMATPTELSQVIELIKLFIAHHAIIFDPMLPGPIYIKRKPTMLSGEGGTSAMDIVSPDTTIRSNLGSTLSVGSYPRAGDSSIMLVQSMASQAAEAALKRNLSEHTSASQSKEMRPNMGERSHSTDDGVGIEGAQKRESGLDSTDILPGRELNEPVDEDSFSRGSEASITLAIAQADFAGTSNRELCFKQGDELRLYRRLNDHWWEGQRTADNKGRRGLVPHTYVAPKAALDQIADLSPTPPTNGIRLDESIITTGMESGSRSESHSVDDGLDDSDEDDDYGVDDDESADDLLDRVSESQVDQNRFSIDSDCIATEQDTTSNQDQSDPVLSAPPVSNALDPIPSVTLRTTTAMTSRLSQPLSTSLVTVPENEVAPDSPTSRAQRAFNAEAGATDSHSRLNSCVDVDNQLADVMMRLASLEQADARHSNSRTIERTRELSSLFQMPRAKHTPDLVMDLPRATSYTLPRSSPHVDVQVARPVDTSSADAFAEQGLDTMRKRPAESGQSIQPDVEINLPATPLVQLRRSTDETNLGSSPPQPTERRSNLTEHSSRPSSPTEVVDMTSSEPSTTPRVSIADRVAAFEIATKSPPDVPGDRKRRVPPKPPRDV